MLLRTKGTSLNIQDFIVGRVTRDPHSRESNAILICDEELQAINADRFSCILTSSKRDGILKDYPAVYKVPSLDHLFEGDLVAVGNDGNIKTLYRVNSFHNTILATERCNSNC